MALKLTQVHHARDLSSRIISTTATCHNGAGAGQNGQDAERDTHGGGHGVDYEVTVFWYENYISITTRHTNDICVALPALTHSLALSYVTPCRTTHGQLQAPRGKTAPKSFIVSERTDYLGHYHSTVDRRLQHLLQYGGTTCPWSLWRVMLGLSFLQPT